MTQLANPNTICTPASRQRSSISARVSTMIAVARQRHALRKLDDHLLADIGVSHLQATQEASRPAWDVPAIWRK
ncbi:DUF1127 domain-containing protein [Yoonia sp.]|uniref:DUF1127 domain-containing protein n=1 Tax=Yoonia sp. TaxID=2212373 RepID=UPI003F6D6751